MDVRLFTSESVCAGHPDKICDAVSDALLDALIEQDPDTRTGIETAVGANQIVIMGEVNSRARIDFQKVTRETIHRLGYTNPAFGFTDQSPFYDFVHQQSPEISIGVDNEGAGDQGLMFGFACNETTALMPMPIALAHSLTSKIDYARIHQEIMWLRPDGKAQVTIRYEGAKPVAVEKVVVAVAHDEPTGPSRVRSDVIDYIITPVLDQFGFAMPDQENIIVNGTGVWHIPGPESDAGVTGRKIVVDTYGGYARVGGGAFSGKDPSKVDRSGAYAARYIAKNIVGKGMADRCEVGLAYAIGKPNPLMKTINTQGSSKASQEEIEAFADQLIDTTVNGIIEKLDLKRPIYSNTVAYGHFGKPGLPWEQLV
jgi:S-adenosylmethionine synthetase